MKIKKETTYKLTFKIEYFESTEFGMDHDQFGDEVTTIEEALRLFELAEIAESDCNWKITCTPEIVVTHI